MLAELPPRGTHCTGREEEEEEEKEEESLFKADAVREIWDQLVPIVLSRCPLHLVHLMTYVLYNVWRL